MKKKDALLSVAFVFVVYIQSASSQIELSVGWPFINNEDWVVGSIHKEKKHCLANECYLNAIDFFKSKSVQQWDHPDGIGEVHAIISGMMYRYDSCFAIQYSSDFKYRIKYYHMGEIDSSISVNGTMVYQGDYIGTYSNNKIQSLCRGGTSSSPHVHISFEKLSDVQVYTPLDLNKIRIGLFFPIVHKAENYTDSCAQFSLNSPYGNAKICPYSSVKINIDKSLLVFEHIKNYKK